MPIPRASSRRLRFSALAAARCRFVFCVFAFARDWFGFVVRVAGCVDDVGREEDCGGVRSVRGFWVSMFWGGAAGGGSGGGVGGGESLSEGLHCGGWEAALLSFLYR